MTSFVTMAEIARIAGVRRQAVTNWRSRSSVVPFPSPARAASGIEHFDRDEVVDWLEATGRGLNEDARLDAPAISIPEGLTVDAAVVMLALRSGAAQDIGPLKPDERIALAQELDPENRYLLAEATSLAADDALAAYVDELLEASYGAADALDRLHATSAAQGSRGLSGVAVVIVQQLAEVCRTFLGPDGVAIELHMDPRDRHVADGFEVAGPQSDRAALRCHAIDDLQVGSAAAPLVKVVSLAGLSDAEALDAAGDISVELDADQIAIVIGPASALCDRLRGELYDVRKAALEMGSMDYGSALCAGFKLPRGLWREAHRQSLGLWVLRGATAATGAIVADMSGAAVDGAELSADLFGALEQTGAHSYRYGRALPYAAVWTGDTVVPPGIGAQSARAVESASAYDRLVSSTLVTREAISGVDLPVARSVSPGLGVERSLGLLVEAGAVKRQSGSRIAPEDVDPAGSVRILTADASAERWIDRLVVAARYNSAVLTEPGDVVFSTNPPRAVVDEVGGAIVATPSRILRLGRQRAGLGPRALAAAINCLGDNSEWKTWPIPAFPPAQVQRVEDALGDVTEYLTRVRKHEAAAASLITSLIQGVAAGAVILDQPNTEKKAG